MEDIKEIQELETTRSTPNQYSNTTEESEKDLILAESDSSLEKSIQALSKDRYEGRKNIRAKVVDLYVIN